MAKEQSFIFNNTTSEKDGLFLLLKEELRKLRDKEFDEALKMTNEGSKTAYWQYGIPEGIDRSIKVVEKFIDLFEGR